MFKLTSKKKGKKRPCDYDLTSNEHVERVAVSRIIEAGHGVEGPHSQWIPVEYIKLCIIPEIQIYFDFSKWIKYLVFPAAAEEALLLQNELTQFPLRLRVQISKRIDLHSRFLQRQDSLGNKHTILERLPADLKI